MCDGASHCGDHDDSDESREPYAGCNRFPGNVSDTKDAESRDTCTRPSSEPVQIRPFCSGLSAITNKLL